MTQTRIIENQEGDKRVSGLLPRVKGAIRYGDRKWDDVWIAVMLCGIVALGFFALAAWGACPWLR